MNYLNKHKLLSEKWLMIVSFVISVLVVFYRRPDAFYNSQFWAEEGTVFYAEAYHLGFKSLFNTCGGYFHLLPRLLACALTTFSVPLHVAAFVFCYGWLLALTVLLIYIWKRLPFSALQRFFIAISVSLIPMQAEVFINLTNVQWILALFPIIIFSSTNIEQNKKWFVIDLLVVVFTALTGPNYTVLLPLFIVLLFLQRHRVKQSSQQMILYGVAIVCGLIVVSALINTGGVNRVEGQFSLLNEGFIRYLFLQYAFLFIGKVALKVPLLIMGLVLIGIVFWMYSVIKRFKNNNDLFVITALLSGYLFIASTLVAYRNDPGLLNPYYNGVRNFYIPAITVIWVFIRFMEGRKFETIALSTLMCVMLINLVTFVGSFTFTDYNLPSYSSQIHMADTISIPVNPPGWYLFIDNSKAVGKE